MGFDGELFGQQMVEIVRGYVAAELDPLRAENKALADRIAELEAREIPVPLQGERGERGLDGMPGKDGAPGERGDPGLDGENGRDGSDGAPGKDGEPGPPGEPGKDGADGCGVDDIEVTQEGATIGLAFTIGERRNEFEFEIPAGPPGADGKDGAPGEKGDPGPAGSLPQVRAWEEGVHYAGEAKSHAGGTWQAVRDTAREPPHDDWICIAARGADGNDGKSLNPRRLWIADEEYRRLDVVARNGGSYVAMRDDPGPCPGEGWMLLTQPGKPGGRGERGEKGERGLPGLSVVALGIDDQGILTLTNGDGTQVQCDLYPLLSRIDRAGA